MSCLHNGDFSLDHRVRRINEDGSHDKPASVFLLELEVTCKLCHSPMQFPGVGFGYTPDRPSKDLTGIQLTIPMQPINLRREEE